MPTAPAARRAPRAPSSTAPTGKPKVEPKILFQSYFKSVGPRTYAAQVKEAGNGNHFLVLTEGKRDDASGDVKKTRLFVFSEDFADFFKLMKQTAEFIKTTLGANVRLGVPGTVQERNRDLGAAAAAKE